MRYSIVVRSVQASIVLWAMAVSSLAAQSAQARSAAAADVRLLDRFPSATAFRLTSVVDSAAAEGLPTRPLVLRALEGQAKSAPDQMIIEVVQRLRVDLQLARQTLGTATSAEELTSAAAALKAGITVDRLKQLRQLRGKQSVTVPLDAWLGLINRGAVPDRAWDHIEGLAKRQARDAEFIRLTPADLTRGVPKGGR